MSKKRQDIETPEQLAGKRVGIADPASVIMTKLILRSAGLQYEDITPVDYKWDLQYIIEDKVDACVGFMNDEPLMLKEQGYEMNVIPGFKHGYDFYSGAYVVTENMLQEQPELVRSFLNATRRGWREAFKRPAETAQLVVGKYFPDGSVSQQTESLKVFETLATLGIREDLLGFMKEREWQKGIDILYEFQQIDKKIPARDLFTLEFLKR